MIDLSSNTSDVTQSSDEIAASVKSESIAMEGPEDTSTPNLIHTSIYPLTHHTHRSSNVVKYSCQQSIMSLYVNISICLLGVQ